MITCKFCGRQLPGGTAFCDACGGKMDVQSGTEGTQPSNAQPSQVFPNISNNQSHQGGQQHNQWNNQWNAPPPGYNPWGAPPPPPPAQPSQRGMIFAIIGLLCGIFAFIIPIPVVDIIVGVAAFVFYFLALKFGQKQGCLMAAVLVFAILGILSAIGFNMMHFGVMDPVWLIRY